MSQKHRLTEKDKQALTATCSICGPGVEIRKAGKYGFVCLTARREARRNWRKAHPDRARRARNYATSGHSLEKRDGGPDNCSKCGVVEVKAWGRGWICANLLAEKGWTSKQTSPEPKCSRCNSAWLIEGWCPECDPDPEYIQKRTVDWFETHLIDAGLTIQPTESALPLDYESAVPGWRTITGGETRVGFAHLADEWSGKPKYIRPEYAALYGSGRGA